MKSYLASFILGLAAMAAFQSFHVKSEVASRETVIRCDDVAPLQDSVSTGDYIVLEIGNHVWPIDGSAFIEETTFEASVNPLCEGCDVHWAPVVFASSRPALHHQLAPPSELRSDLSLEP
jgi:hypothetical protein